MSVFQTSPGTTNFGGTTNFATAPIAVGSSDQTLDSGVPTTFSPNPSLGASPVTLSATGGAALNTVAANPTVYSSGSQGLVSDLSEVGSAVGQWGSGLASLFGGGPSSSIKTMATGSTPGMSSTTKIVLIAAVAVVVLLLVMRA